MSVTPPAAPTSTHFNFYTPTEIEFGAGVLQKLPGIIQRFAARRVLVVGDPGLVKAGLVARVTDLLDRHDIAYDTFTDLKSDPEVRSVRAGSALAREKGADLVVAIGGGSAMDTAKGIGLMMRAPGRIEDYFGIDKILEAGSPVIAIPTTAGTGSEVTVWSVLHDTDADQKVVIGSPFICPRIALLDPELSLSLPGSITAATGMDALTHAVESYVNKLCHPFVEACAEKAIALIGQNLRLAVAQGEHIEARGNMLLASSLAGMAFNRVRLGLVHAFSLPLGNKYHIPHGMVNGIMLPAVMQFNVPGNLPKYKRVAELLGESTVGLGLREAAMRSVRAVTQLKADIGLTDTLADYGVSPDGFDAVIAEAMTSGNVAVNPRMPTLDDMKRMLAAGLAGDQAL